VSFIVTEKEGTTITLNLDFEEPANISTSVDLDEIIIMPSRYIIASKGLPEVRELQATPDEEGGATP
jgi:hypothetical protein